MSALDQSFVKHRSEGFQPRRQPKWSAVLPIYVFWLLISVVAVGPVGVSGQESGRKDPAPKASLVPCAAVIDPGEGLENPYEVYIYSSPSHLLREIYGGEAPQFIVLDLLDFAEREYFPEPLSLFEPQMDLSNISETARRMYRRYAQYLLNRAVRRPLRNSIFKKATPKGRWDGNRFLTLLEPQQRYTVVILNGQVILAKTGENFGRDILSKHILLSDRARVLSFAGEVLIDHEGVFHLYSDSGSYMPTEAHLENAIHFFRKHLRVELLSAHTFRLLSGGQ